MARKRFLKTRLEKILLLLLILMFILEVILVAQPEGYAALMRVFRRPQVEDGFLWMMPSTLNPKVNETFTVQVMTAKAVDLYGIQFDMTYNSAVLEYVSIEEGDFLEENAAETFWLTPDSGTLGTLGNIGGTRVNTMVDPEAALPGDLPPSVEIPALNTPGTKGVNGEGHLVTLNFEVIGLGLTKLKISEILPANSEGRKIQRFLRFPLNLRVRE